jgi:hypothetical protein
MAFDQIRSVVAALESDIASGPIVPTVAPHEIRAYLGSRYDFTKPMALDDVTADVEWMMRNWQVQVTHPRYFGLFNPSVTLASVVADTLVAMYNPQLATWRTSPAANEIERHTLSWLTGKFGLPATTRASFTSGGAEANLSAVIVALTRAFPQYGEGGLRSLSASPTIYLTREAHDSFSKIAHLTGIGRGALRMVATDGDLKMDLRDLARQVEEDRRNGLAPVMVVGTAGTTAAGAIDPLADLARFCRSEELGYRRRGAGAIFPLRPRSSRRQSAAPTRSCDAQMVLDPDGRRMFFRHLTWLPRRSARRPRCRTQDGRSSMARPRCSGRAGSSADFLASRGTRSNVAMIEHQAHGRRPAGIAPARGMARRHARRCARGFTGMARRLSSSPRLRASDRVDVGSSPGRRRAGRARVCDKFPDKTVGHRVGRRRDEPAPFA